MKMKKLFFGIVASLFFLNSSTADVLTFDEFELNNGFLVLSNIGPFEVLNFGLADRDANPGTGYEFGNVSPENVAYNPFAQPMQFSLIDPVVHFDFEGAYFTGAWRDGLQILVTGLDGGDTIYSSLITVDSTAPTWFEFDFENIDTLILASFGGVDAGYGGGAGDQHFVMDNFTFTVNAIPEPSSFLAVWLMTMSVTMRRRK